MKTILKEASEGRPEVPVLYCESHGHYGMSLVFQDFKANSTESPSLAAACVMTRVNEDYHDRVSDAALIRPFGQKVRRG